MSSSEDEGDFDIASNIAGLTGDSSDSEDYSSDSDNEQQGQMDYQDEIISSDEEEQEEKEPETKKRKVEPPKKIQPDLASFPTLEASDDEEDVTSKTSEYFAMQPQSSKKVKAGTFASFNLSKNLLHNIQRKGFRQPTPIQRKTIPLILQARDIVGMARTGSGKTGAFSIPLIERLKVHSAKVGVRAIVLSPSRELALQTYKVIKEFSRGSDLRSVLLIGGDSLEDQFGMMMSNPDIVVATPGRFLHLKIEMGLDLKSVEYIVFDEADRLFEMGFEEQLNELLVALPPNRQSLLFSATLPRSLVDFAKAGLTNPVLVRLDAETKVSDELEMAFFSTKRDEREANLLSVIQDVIKIPLATPEELKKLEGANQFDSSDEEDEDNKDEKNKKRKKKFQKPKLPAANVLPSPFSTIVFVPTRHHVEYITTMLRDAGFAVSYIYGTLDQRARKQQLLNFRAGLTPLLVVTDVAARGIDVPVLANVINYSLPASSKIFVHRVGRTARAGNRGWAYSIVSDNELPYLLDLELFLGKKIYLTPMHEAKIKLLKEQMGDDFKEPKISYIDRMVLGACPRLNVENMMEMFNHLITNNYDLKVLQGVSLKAEKLYFKTRTAAGGESVKRAKEIKNNGWDDQHLLFGENMEKAKLDFLEKLQHRRNKETVFEFSKKDESMMDLMRIRRRQIAPIQRRAKEKRELLEKERLAGLTHGLEDEILKGDEGEVGYSVTNDVLEKEFETEQEAKFGAKAKKTFRDPQYFISHYAPSNVIQDQQLNINSGFLNDAAKASFDLNDDDKIQNHKQTQTMQWDKGKKNYVNAKSTDKKYIIGESGQKIPASYRSGRYDNWKNQRKLPQIKTGAREQHNPSEFATGRDPRFKHNKTQAPKAPDRFRDDYQTQKKKVNTALENGMRVKGFNKPGQRNEIRSTEDIRKSREAKQKRMDKNARPSRKRK